jgi:hypothetical protein
MKIDMHIHSSYSPDGRERPADILKYARKIGLDAVAITDHNEIKGALEAKKLGIIPVVVGIEVSTRDGHILGYGIDCLIPRGLGAAETVEKIHECGGVAVIAHPFRFWSGVGRKVAEELVSAADAVEIFNSRCKKSSNRKAQKLADEHGKPGTAGSDAHRLERIGRGYLIADCAPEDFPDCIKHVRGTAHGTPRTAGDTIKYVKKSVLQWMGRGFKKI